MDPRKRERIRECPDNPSDALPTGEQFNALGMVLSLVALLMKVVFSSVEQERDLIFLGNFLAYMKRQICMNYGFNVLVGELNSLLEWQECVSNVFYF